MKLFNRQGRTHHRLSGLPRQGWWIFVGAIVLSLLTHAGSLVELARVATTWRPGDLALQQKSNVKFRVLDEATVREMKKQIPQSHEKRIVEVKQKPTEMPDDARFLGAQNHKTDHEMKLSHVVPHMRAADAGTAGSVAAGGRQKEEPRLGFLKKPSSGTISTARPKIRNNMDALLPQAGELVGQMNQGYQDYIDGDMAEGDRIDVNTTEYRYMGYMTHLRKAIELVWVYPMDAVRRGFQGVGTCHFTIDKDGRVRLVKVASSTGYDILDRAFIEAVRMAAIPPLPASFNRDNFPVSFGYRYVIGSYAAH